jgi:glucose/arabinose dehydrogenase
VRKGEASVTRLEDFRNETWEEQRDGRPVTVEQVVGNSGVYLIITDQGTGEVLRDDRPWQMTARVS